MTHKNKKINHLEILDKKEERKLLDLLEEQFGILEIPGIIVKRGEERLFLFQGILTKQEIKLLERTVPVERVGVYFAKLVQEKDKNKTSIRLSIEGTLILQNQLTKNIFELSEKQLEEWMKGRELDIPTKFRGFVIMKHKSDFLGCGKASEKKITNFISKTRRLKEKS